MILSRTETVMLFELVLGTDEQGARIVLNARLNLLERSEPEFYSGVIEHLHFLEYSSEEWFDFLSKIPERIFRYEPRIMNKLSQAQREKLPPAVFEAR